MALNVTDLWFVKDVKFNVESKRLDVYIDFKKGSIFSFFDTEEEKEIIGLKAYDTNSKTWKHLNFFEHECYLHARVPRVKLTNGKVKQMQTPWEGLSNGFTLLGPQHNKTPPASPLNPNFQKYLHKFSSQIWT